MNPQDLPAVLQWLAGPGSAYVIGWILSLVVENVPAWGKIPRVWKFIIPMIASVLVSIGSTLLLRNTELVSTLGPIWSVVVGAFISYLGSQQAFLSEKRSGYGFRGTPVGIREKRDACLCSGGEDRNGGDYDSVR